MRTRPSPEMFMIYPGSELRKDDNAMQAASVMVTHTRDRELEHNSKHKQGNSKENSVMTCKLYDASFSFGAAESDTLA